MSTQVSYTFRMKSLADGGETVASFVVTCLPSDSRSSHTVLFLSSKWRDGAGEMAQWQLMTGTIPVPGDLTPSWLLHQTYRVHSYFYQTLISIN